MNTPAISATAAARAPRPALAPRPVHAPGPRAHARGEPGPLSTRPAGSRPAARAGWEILAGAVLLVGWTILWVFFLDAVVHPAAALHAAASPAVVRRAAAAPSLMGVPLPAR